MVMDVLLYKYNWRELVTGLKDIGITDTKKLKQMLLAFGEKCQYSYYLLNNEYWEDFNSFYLLPDLIDEHFKVEDSFDVFVKSGEILDMSKSMEEVKRELGLNK